MDKKNKGCFECKDFWQFSSVKMPNPVFFNEDRQSALYCCPNCQSYWEESQRFSNILSDQELREYYFEYFCKLKKG